MFAYSEYPGWIGYSIQDPSVGYVWSDGSAVSKSHQFFWWSEMIDYTIK